MAYRFQILIVDSESNMGLDNSLGPFGTIWTTEEPAAGRYTQIDTIESDRVLGVHNAEDDSIVQLRVEDSVGDGYRLTSIIRNGLQIPIEDRITFEHSENNTFRLVYTKPPRAKKISFRLEPDDISANPQVYGDLTYVSDEDGLEKIIEITEPIFEVNAKHNTPFRFTPRSTILDHYNYELVVNGEVRRPYLYELQNIDKDWEFVVRYKPKAHIVDVAFGPTEVNIRDNQTPPTVPKLYVTYKNTSKITITGDGFNRGFPLVKTVEETRDTNQLITHLSYDLWEKVEGTKVVTITASNSDRETSTANATVKFTNVIAPPSIDGEIKCIKSFSTDKSLIFKDQKLKVTFSSQNVEHWPIDDRGMPLPVTFYLEDYDDDSASPIVIGNAKLSDKTAEISLPNNITTKSYKVFAYLPAKGFNSTSEHTEEKLYSNTILTIIEGTAPTEYTPLTQQQVVNNIMGAICSQFALASSYSDFINEHNVLQNLLVDRDSVYEELIISHVEDIDNSIILKLYDTLNRNFTTKDEFYLVREVIDPFIASVDLESSVDDGPPIIPPVQPPGIVPPPGTLIPLRGANTSIDDYMDLGLPLSSTSVIDINSTPGTGFLSTDDIGDGQYNISGSVISDILNTVISGSDIIDDKELNINYESFDNFVFYSSAKERLINFRNKLDLIQIHQVSIENINSGAATGSSEVIAEVSSRNQEINKIINGFDGYETFLYYSDDASAWPKVYSVVQPTTSSLGLSYFTSQSLIAEEYDTNNQYSLIKDIPEHIRRDSNNDSFLTFVSLVGHHFDLIKTHVDSLQKIFVRTHDESLGTPEKLVRPVLEAFGWQIKTHQAQDDIANYLLGKHKDGTRINSTSSKSRKELLHRRFINNLPYIYKTKGTRAAIRALFTIYGIPESIIDIREFGGPALTKTKKTYYQFEDPTAVLNLSGTENISLSVLDSDLSRRPDTFELTFKSSEMPVSSSSSGSYNLFTTDASFSVFLDSEPSSSYNGRVRVNLNETQISSSKLPLFDDEWFTLMVRRTVSGSNDIVDLFVKKALYASMTHESSASMTINGSDWESISSLTIGNNYSGSIDEFRMWKNPLSEDSFDHHVFWKESIRGNHYTSSITDLLFRLPFEQPQNLFSDTSVKNYAFTSSNGYGVGTATANNFSNIVDSPYQYSWIDIQSAYEAPSIAFRNESDKIRFENIELLDGATLNPTTRATKKSLDMAPIDTNKVGVFFSPTNEINRDIVRAFTGYDFLNEIGDPESLYSSSYAELDAINEHYWSRHNAGMNIYDYITLIRQLDRSVFEYIDQVSPVRANIAKGLLIEPHLLERNRHPHRKPSKEDLYWSGEYDTAESRSTTAEWDVHEAIEKISESIDLYGGYPLYVAENDTTEDQSVESSYLTYSSSIDKTISDNDTIAEWLVYETGSASTQGGVPSSIKNQDEIGINTNVYPPDWRWKVPSELGEPQTAFGIFGVNGESELIFRKDGQERRKRYKLEIVTVTETKNVKQLVDGQNDGQAGEYHEVEVTSSYTQLNVLHITGSITGTPLNGYLPQHRTRVTDLTQGLKNSFYEGAVQSAATTIDGGDPVEVNLSKARTIKVIDSNSDGTEPILEIE